MLRLITIVMIFVLSYTYTAWAQDVHFVSFNDHVIAQGDTGVPDADAALDPDHCSHGVDHLSGMVESCSLTTLIVAHAPVRCNTVVSSFPGSPPAKPPKA